MPVHHSHKSVSVLHYQVNSNIPFITGFNVNDTIDNNLSKCISGASDFFHTYRDAFLCLLGSNKDIAFVKHDINNDGGMSMEIMV